jgi:2-keto-4-pentenoate hydratase/2-oxohepta-3-ene-1,7-dioic acid hydratase in catechol pathway
MAFRGLGLGIRRMRLVSFLHEGTPRVGAVKGTEVIDLTARLPAEHGSLEGLLRDGALVDAARAMDRPGPRHKLASLHWLMPIPNPRRVFCVGANYPKRNPLGGTFPPAEHPVIFQKDASALVPHLGTLQMPIGSEQLDYEGELACIIGRAGFGIPESEAASHVAGYAPFNDGSVRDRQQQSLWAGKNGVRTGSFGPWMMTADEVGEPEELRLMTRLNGEVVQDEAVSRMIFPVSRVIAYLSRITPLLPGDVIALGSPEGSGASQSPPQWLKPGDRLEFEIEGVGILENQVVAA